ncbi:hypothetical protein ACWGK6_41640, partial [Streptomyces violaceusniger]
PMSDRDKDAEILALRHQITVLERQLGGARLRFTSSDRALLAALLHRMPLPTLRRLRLLVRPDTVLRWHRGLARRQHAAVSRPKRPGRPRTVRSIRILVLRLARENPNWGYRRLHGELLVLGVKVAASTVWKILKESGVDPAPGRSSSTWAGFLPSQADALLACDFFETVTLSGARMYVLVVIEHSSRRIRILGAIEHPTTSWVTQAAKNLVNAHGALIHATNADAELVLERDRLGRLVAETVNGRTTTYGYDAAGHQTHRSCLKGVNIPIRLLSWAFPVDGEAVGVAWCGVVLVEQSTKYLSAPDCASR